MSCCQDKNTEKGNATDEPYVKSLAPDCSELSNNAEYDVYTKYLDKAFEDETIRNIAITGNYGVGKSCIIKKWSQGKKYLFVSLCNFVDNSNNDTQRQKNLECDLLQQIMLGCANAVKSSNDKRKLKSTDIGAAGVIIALTAFFLVFYKTLKDSFLELGFSLINDGVFKIMSAIKFAVYLLFAVVMVVGIVCMIKKIIDGFNLSKIALKLQGIELDLDIKNDSTFSYMERHRYDLVNALRNAAENIEYTVIFEDMDRLDMDDCRMLFTELRELNRLVNSGDFGKDADKIIRFVYVIHDAVFYNEENTSDTSYDKLLSLKFFDYSISIMPRMISKGASEYVKNCFKKVDFKDEFFINEISKYLFDYRLINQITNEYVVAKDVYTNRIKTDEFSSDDEKELMAFVIYKTVMPDDYKKIREGTSSIFPITDGRIVSDNNPTIKNKEYNEIVKCLLKNGWLPYTCLRFVGYDHSDIKEYMKKFFDNDSKIEHDSIRQKMICEDFDICRKVLQKLLNDNNCNLECLGGVLYTLLEQIVKSSEKSYYGILKQIPSFSQIPREKYLVRHEDALKDFMKNCSNDSASVDKISAVLEYLVKINHSDFSWFFEGCDEETDRLLDDIRWRMICDLDISILEIFVKRYEKLMIEWLNELHYERGIPRNWDKYCSEETALVLLNLNFDIEIKNWLDFIIIYN